MSATASLSDIALLSELEAAELAELEEAVNTRVYKKNSVVVSQGDDTDSLYLIVSGSVRVYVSDENGREVTLNTLHAGDSFGELALLSDQARSASVLTLEDTELGCRDTPDRPSSSPSASRNRSITPSSPAATSNELKSQ